MSLKSQQKQRAAQAQLTQYAAQAKQLYGAGQMRKALALLEQALRGCTQFEPAHAELLNIAAACALQLGNAGLAERYWRQAMAANPASADVPNNLGILLTRLGRSTEAEALFRQAAALRQDYPDPHFNLAALLMSLGRHAEAETACRAVIALRPQQPAAYNSLGALLSMTGRLDEAEAALRQAVALKPDYAEALNNLGALYGHQHKLTEAEQAYRAALAAQPQYAEAGNNLAMLLGDSGRVDEADALFRRVLDSAPDFVGALHNFAMLLGAQGRGEEAEALYRRVLALQPGHVEAHNGLGILLASQRRIDEAVAQLRQALALRPDHIDTLNNLGEVLLSLPANLPEAEPVYRRLVELLPESGHYLAQWLSIRRFLCDWEGCDAIEQRLVAAIERGHTKGIAPFQLLSLRHITSAHLRTAGHDHAWHVAAPQLTAPALVTARPQPKPRLRIGYLSADLHAHATAWLMSGVLEQHDTGQFEIFLYSYGSADDSPERQRLRAACTLFRDLRALSDEAAAAQIVADGVDILVDLKGYTIDSRTGITALRPAPLILSWLGYPATLGEPRLADYFIGDRIASPLEHAKQFSETLALLPECYQPNDRERAIGPRPTRTEAGLPASGFVFCNFNQSYKTTPESFALWCRLLAAVPGSVLWLLASPHPGTDANLRRAAEAHGIDPARLVFAPKCAQTAHLGRAQLADLALDTFPCASHTTASDMLWAGVPLLTRQGEGFVSRVAASILYTAGLPELIVDSDEQYFQQALTLATTPASLQALRARLAENRLRSPLFDTARYTRHLEKLYRQIWAQECAGVRQALLVEPEPPSL